MKLRGNCCFVLNSVLAINPIDKINLFYMMTTLYNIFIHINRSLLYSIIMCMFNNEQTLHASLTITLTSIRGRLFFICRLSIVFQTKYYHSNNHLISRLVHIYEYLQSEWTIDSTVNPMLITCQAMSAPVVASIDEIDRATINIGTREVSLSKQDL